MSGNSDKVREKAESQREFREFCGPRKFDCGNSNIYTVYFNLAAIGWIHIT